MFDVYVVKYIEGIIKVEEDLLIFLVFIWKGVFSRRSAKVPNKCKKKRSDLQNKQILTYIDQWDAEYDRTCKSSLMLSSFVYMS